MKKNIFLSVVVIVVIVVMLFIIDTKNKDYTPDIIESCQNLIKKELKAPSSFFQTNLSAYVQNSIPTLAIEFDAQNSFGVPLRNICYFSFRSREFDSFGFPEKHISFENFESLELNDVVCSKEIAFQKHKGRFINWEGISVVFFENNIIELGYDIPYIYDTSIAKKDFLHDGKVLVLGKKHYLDSPLKNIQKYSLWEKLTIRVKKILNNN